MELLRPLLVAALLAPAGCYEPRLADCTVRCSSSEDCGPGHGCGDHGFCAAPDIACDPVPADAPPPPGDGRRPDAEPKSQLRVKISKSGKVHVEAAGSCDSEGPQEGDCLFTVTAGVPLTLRAIPHGGFTFKEWTSHACENAGSTCVLTPDAPLTEVHAEFERI